MLVSVLIKGVAKLIGYVVMVFSMLLATLFLSKLVYQMLGQIPAFVFFAILLVSSLFAIYVISRLIVNKFVRVCTSSQQRY